MAIVVRCSDCGALLKFRDEAVGKRAKCTKCSRVVQVRADGDSRQGHENDDAEFVDNLADATAVAASSSKRRPVRPNPKPESAAATGTTRVKACPDECVLMGASSRVRIVVLVLMLLPIGFVSLFGRPECLTACFVPMMLTGTFRTSKIRGDRLTTRLHVAFFPVVSNGCNLRGVNFVNVKYGRDGSGLGTFLLFGPVQVLYGRFFDFLMPSIGGPYQIHLVTAKGRELVAWQGSAEPQFRSKLDLLVGLTKAELQSM